MEVNWGRPRRTDCACGSGWERIHSALSGGVKHYEQEKVASDKLKGRKKRKGRYYFAIRGLKTLPTDDGNLGKG